MAPDVEAAGPVSLPGQRSPHGVRQQRGHVVDRGPALDAGIGQKGAVRGHPQWRELFSHLAELGIKVAVHQELPKVQRAYQGYLRRQRDAHRVGMVKPTAGQQAVEKLFPAIAQWVRGYGYIEIGEQEMFGFAVRALGYGGMPFEDDRPDTLAEGLAALEQGLRKWFEEQRIEVEGRE